VGVQLTSPTVAQRRPPFTGTRFPTMKHKLATTLLATLVATVAVACADGPSAPLTSRASAAPSLAVGTTATTKVKVKGVQWKRPLTRSYSATALIGPEGGVLELPETGLRLTVPAGAVSRPIQFQAVAQQGRQVAYHFYPSGTRFAVPLRLEQAQSQIERPAGAPGQQPELQLGYFAGDADLDDATGTAAVTELNVMLETNSSSAIAFPVYHFSGYLVSWGRR
jgi:hypothetical protein